MERMKAELEDLNNSLAYIESIEDELDQCEEYMQLKVREHIQQIRYQSQPTNKIIDQSWVTHTATQSQPPNKIMDKLVAPYFEMLYLQQY